MIRAFKLEWLKMKNYRVFWVLLIMYIVALIVISSFGMFLLEWLKSKGADFDGIDPTILPIYDFPDIWQNTTYLAAFAKLLLAFIVIISVSNDLTYNTMRQNIIDGINKKEFVLSKLSLIVFLTIISSLTLFLSGLVNGSIYSHVHGAANIFDELEFLLAYSYDIIVYCSLAIMLSLVIKKAGFVIVALFLYTLMFEPILSVFLENADFLNGSFWPEVPQYFPIHALNDMIPVPFPKYVFMEVDDNVPLKAVVISTCYFAIYLWSINFLLTKKDLK